MREMKNSGIEWLGEIPACWDTLRLKNIATFRRGTQIRKEDCVDSGTPLINYGQIHSRLNTGTGLDDALVRFAPSRLFEGKAPICKGDLLFATTSEDLDAIGSAAFIDKDGIYAGSDSLVCHFVKRNYTKYFAYLALTHQWRDQIRRITNGIKVFHLTQERLSNAIVVLPPYDEQIRIVEYLDEKCEAIDSAIEAAEQSIEEYNAYKKSLIFEKVTKGLDSSVEMRDSGNEWLGEIPAKWGLNRIGALFVERKAKVSDHEYQPLSVTKRGVILQLETVAKSDDHSNRKLVCVGDFVINSRSDRRNSCGFSELDGSVSLINIVLKPVVQICSRYYGHLFDSVQFADELYSFGHGIAADLWTTSWTDMKKICLPTPSLDEQQRIAEYLDIHCARIDAVIESKISIIEELKLYKKSLIYEVVTGKREIDGR